MNEPMRSCPGCRSIFGLEESHYCPTHSFSGMRNSELARLRKVEQACRDLADACMDDEFAEDEPEAIDRWVEALNRAVAVLYPRAALADAPKETP